MTVPVDPRLSPISPWGVAVVDVAALTTNVRILDALPTGVQPHSTVDITVATVRSWIDEVSQLVVSSLGEYARVTDRVKSEQIVKAAKTITVNGVASYVVDAAFPNLASVNNNTYSSRLWQRYKDGLAALVLLVAQWIEVGGVGITPVNGTGLDGAGSSFPCPSIIDRQPF